MITYTEKEFLELFKEKSEKVGRNNIEFVCCKCKTKQTIQDFINSGLTKEEAHSRIGFSCIGRVSKEKGCDWSLGGFFRIHEVEVIRENGVTPMFKFAD